MKKALAVIAMLSLFCVAYNQDGNLKKQTYIRFGFSMPSWKYFGYDDKSYWPDDETKRTGLVFETGSIFMLNSIKLAPGMRLGINADFLSVAYNRFNSESPLGTYSDNFWYIGSKLGPSFSYSPVKRLVFDAYFKFNPVWVAADFAREYDDNEIYLGFLGIKYSVGLNVRYSILMLGMEFNPGFAKIRWFDQDEKELTHVYLSNVNDNSKKTPVPSMNFTIGLSF